MIFIIVNVFVLDLWVYDWNSHINQYFTERILPYCQTVLNAVIVNEKISICYLHILKVTKCQHQLQSSQRLVIDENSIPSSFFGSNKCLQLSYSTSFVFCWLLLIFSVWNFSKANRALKENLLLKVTYTLKRRYFECRMT